MRRGEILNLTWDNVDLRNGYLLVTQSKNGDRREVPINAAVRQELAGTVRRLDSTHVFCDEKGKVFKGGRNAFERACKRAGIYNFHFHDLRHTAASSMAMGGVDLMSIKQILGHKTIQMTLRYSHLSPGHLRNAVAAIDRALTSLFDPTSQFTSQLTESSLPAGTSAGVTARF
jgi:integrase